MSQRSAKLRGFSALPPRPSSPPPSLRGQHDRWLKHCDLRRVALERLSTLHTPEYPIFWPSIQYSSAHRVNQIIRKTQELLGDRLLSLMVLRISLNEYPDDCLRFHNLAAEVICCNKVLQRLAERLGIPVPRWDYNEKEAVDAVETVIGMVCHRRGEGVLYLWLKSISLPLIWACRNECYRMSWRYKDAKDAWIPDRYDMDFEDYEVYRGDIAEPVPGFAAGLISDEEVGNMHDARLHSRMASARGDTAQLTKRKRDKSCEGRDAESDERRKKRSHLAVSSSPGTKTHPINVDAEDSAVPARQEKLKRWSGRGGKRGPAAAASRPFTYVRPSSSSTSASAPATTSPCLTAGFVYSSISKPQYPGDSASSFPAGWSTWAACNPSESFTSWSSRATATSPSLPFSCSSGSGPSVVPKLASARSAATVTATAPSFRTLCGLDPSLRSDLSFAPTSSSHPPLASISMSRLDTTSWHSGASTAYRPITSSGSKSKIG